MNLSFPAHRASFTATIATVMLTVASAALGAPTLVRLMPDPLEGRTSFEPIVNLCVDRVTAGQFDAAVGACDLAVSRARWGATPLGGGYVALLSEQRDLAIALNNRAVLRLLRGEESLALADAQAAVRLSHLPEAVATEQAIASR